MIYLTFLTAIALSGVAAYYSVIGLAAIFPGSFWPIVLMGSVLEASKLVTVSWLYRNWKISPLPLKSYLSASIVILMLITSMGIFGYLSKAHLEHSADTAPLALKVEMLDEKIRVAKENINEDRKALKQMDEAVDQTMVRSQDEKGADKAVALRQRQAKERTRLLSNIETQQKVIAELGNERSPLYVELSKAESDFGPIKYVAELIYGSGEKDIIDKAVRLVIMLIMVVFDPLAVLLLIAANMSFKLEKESDSGVIEFFNRARKTARSLDDGTYEPPKEHVTKKVVEVEEDNLANMDDKPKQDDGFEPATVVTNKEEPLAVNPVTGEEIYLGPTPPTRVEHHAPGVYTEHYEVTEVKKKLEPKYDYNAEYAFKEKEK